jgi:hypothetical protein
VQEEGAHHQMMNKGLVSKIQLSEEELDAVKKDVKESMEKWYTQIM